jgi:hypothetical protein
MAEYKVVKTVAENKKWTLKLECLCGIQDAGISFYIYKVDTQVLSFLLCLG